MLITIALCVAAAGVLTAFVALVRHDGGAGSARPMHGADAVYADELAAMHAPTVQAAEAALDAPVRRTLAVLWHDLVEPPPVPELVVVPGHGPVSGHQPGCSGCVQAALDYHGRHNVDTVELHRVPSGYMPPIGARRNAALLGDTRAFEAVQA